MEKPPGCNALSMVPRVSWVVLHGQAFEKKRRKYIFCGVLVVGANAGIVAICRGSFEKKCL